MELKQSSGGKKMFGVYCAVLIPIGIAINYVGGMAATALSLPIFLDSIGTVIVAAILGPWPGAISGLLYNVIMAATQGNMLQSLFGLCNIGTGLIVGYYVRAGKFRTWWHLTIVTIWVTLVNTVIGSAVAAYVFGGVSGGGGFNVLVGVALATVKDVFSAQMIASLPANIVDKGLGVIIGWLILRRLPDNMKTLSGAKLEQSPGYKGEKAE